MIARIAQKTVYSLVAAVLGLWLAGSPEIRAQQESSSPGATEDETLLQIPEIGGDPALGRRLYMEGIGADGEPVRALLQGDIAVSGTQATCTTCHRPSGMGSSEGTAYVPPITAGSLFIARELDRHLRNERFKETYKEAQTEEFSRDLRKPRLRPAYSEETLAKALREGVDPAGRVFNPTMPRYELSDADIDNLIAFLSGLSRDWDPGVERETIHFATIVHEDVDRERARAMTDTIWAFASWMNTDTRTDVGTPGFSPYYKSEFVQAYRLWKPHGWTLTGPPETWGKQLEAYYEEQPVFAILGGMVDGAYAPVDAFCDEHGIPCLFPETELPATDRPDDGYTVYYSRGLELEAEALAAYFAALETPPQRIRQIAAEGPHGETPKAAFQDALVKKLPGAELETRPADGPEGLKAAIAESLASGGADALVVWPGRDGAAAVDALKGADLEAVEHVVLSSDAADAAQAAWREEAPEQIRIVSRYDDPAAVHPDSYRARAWMRTRGIGIRDWDLQRKTFFMLKMVQFSLNHMLTDFHRDYMIEIIEHEAENAYDTGPYPQLALGPGQRFASKGAYIMALTPEGEGGLTPVSDWIVP